MADSRYNSRSPTDSWLRELQHELKNANGYLKYASPLAFFLLLCTMVGALLIEFFVRPSPEIMLVSIAIILIAGALFGIKYNKATILSVLSSD